MGLWCWRGVRLRGLGFDDVIFPFSVALLLGGGGGGAGPRKIQVNEANHIDLTSHE